MIDLYQALNAPFNDRFIFIDESTRTYDWAAKLDTPPSSDGSAMSRKYSSFYDYLVDFEGWDLVHITSFDSFDNLRQTRPELFL